MDIRLRQYKASDAQTIVSWIKDEETLRKWSIDRFKDFPITSEDVNNKYLSLNGDCEENDNFYPFVAFDDDGVVGHLILRYVNKDKKVIRFGFVIVDSSKRGQGLGKKMLNLAIKYTFDIYGADKITIGVLENNESAYRCYKSVGFKETMTVSTCELFGKQERIIELEMNKQ